MEISINIGNIQHIARMEFNINLSDCKLTCLVGRNGAGKTTLVKALNNISSADTFKKTSSDSIFNESSFIEYKINNETYEFNFDKTIKSLNCKKIIPEPIKRQIDVELPMPYGERFNFFQSVSDADLEIRRSIILENYSTPIELIELLSRIYENDKFKSLVEVKIKNTEYYCILLEDNKYIREDYLSSGEYFLISLYRKIKNRRKLIVIDEIDISLDAAAQSHLVENLRNFCARYEVNVLFTTHSLAMMRTLQTEELLYIRNDLEKLEIIPASYNYIKATLFGFIGWDRYILTEDKVLQRFIEYTISRYCIESFFEYKIIYVGGGENVADLLRRNISERFLSTPENVIAILDGDQRDFRHAKKESIYCIPIESVEKALFSAYQDSSLPARPESEHPITTPKKLYGMLIRQRLMSEAQVFCYLCDVHNEKMREFSKILERFLSLPE